jgi:hypothetical protein
MPNKRHPQQRQDFVPGQFIVRFKPDAVQTVAHELASIRPARRAAKMAMPDEIEGPIALLRKAGAESITPMFTEDRAPRPQRRSGEAAEFIHLALARSATHSPRDTLRGFQMVEIADKKASGALMKKLKASRAVEFAELVPNRWPCARRLRSAADPMLNRQWGLRAIHWFDRPRPDASLVDVAILDSGVDDGHPDLNGAIASYVPGALGKRDKLGHGTHVAGIIAAAVNNGVGIAGIAGCRLHCWKIFADPPAGSTDASFDFNTYSNGLAATLDSAVKVVNLSIGGTASSNTEAVLFRELREAGVLTVAAMGNEFEDGNPDEFPAAYEDVVAVGAVDEMDRRAPFSCTGKHIALVAPGVNILSTVPRQKSILADNVDYDSWPGTSMATPHVAACAALAYATLQRSMANRDAIVKKMQDKAIKLPSMKGKSFTTEYGFGLVDLSKLV